MLFPARPGQAAEDRRRRQSSSSPTDFYLVAWTTTPWTMPGHSGLAVHPELVYRVVEHPTRPGRAPALRRRDREPRSRTRSRARASAQRRDLRDQPALARVPRARRSQGLRYDRPYRADALRRAAESRPGLRSRRPPTRTAGWWCSPTTSPPPTAPASCTPRRPSAPTTTRRDRSYGLPLFQTVEADGKIAAQAGARALRRPLVQGRGQGDHPRPARSAGSFSTPSATATATRSAGAATRRSSSSPPRAGSSGRPPIRDRLVAQEP